jgi:Histidinol phosphatase and related hydrolases of the PHP family
MRFSSFHGKVMGGLDRRIFGLAPKRREGRSCKLGFQPVPMRRARSLHRFRADSSHTFGDGMTQLGRRSGDPWHGSGRGWSPTRHDGPLRRLGYGLALGALMTVIVSGCSYGDAEPPDDGRMWLAGDHHVHSEFSGGYDHSTNPPTFNDGGDGTYPILRNVEMAQKYGLKWMVTTDHGGPLHSVIQRERAYPALLEARNAFPGMKVFYGMELDTPKADHSTVWIPKTDREAQALFEIESQFAVKDAWPEDPERNTEERMIEALRYMSAMPDAPIVIKNHPSRTARGPGRWGIDTPEKLRRWHDAAPDVFIGFEGAPGHQAASLNSDPSSPVYGVRGAYHHSPTMGGFDQMTAVVGGVWDAFLGEGRRWWITATSDSHLHYTEEGGIDFWPGEYTKTYVKARDDYADIYAQIRAGHMFAVTGDLISELDITAREKRPFGWMNRTDSAVMGQTLAVRSGADVEVTIRFRIPDQPNANGDRPSVRRVDLIMGDVAPEAIDTAAFRNPTTEVVRRFYEGDWKVDGEYAVISYTIQDVDHNVYLRVRGTNTNELEPEPDEKGENPWEDLWFYSNPIFIEVNGDG